MWLDFLLCLHSFGRWKYHGRRADRLHGGQRNAGLRRVSAYSSLARATKARFLAIAVRYLLPFAFLPAPALAQEPSSVPIGRALLDPPPGEFQSYVSGIYNGQALLAAAPKVLQIICVDPMTNRKELALDVLRGIAQRHERALRRPDRVVVFRVLIEKLPCPGLSWEKGG